MTGVQVQAHRGHTKDGARRRGKGGGEQRLRAARARLLRGGLDGGEVEGRLGHDEAAVGGAGLERAPERARPQLRLQPPVHQVPPVDGPPDGELRDVARLQQLVAHVDLRGRPPGGAARAPHVGALPDGGDGRGAAAPRNESTRLPLALRLGGAVGEDLARRGLAGEADLAGAAAIVDDDHLLALRLHRGVLAPALQLELPTRAMLDRQRARAASAGGARARTAFELR